jgi:hypothetical protein
MTTCIEFCEIRYCGTLAVHEADARLEPVFAVAYLRDVPEARQQRARTLGEDLAGFGLAPDRSASHR